MTTAAAAVTRKEVQLSHGKTTYLEQGSGQPVILIHGAAVTGGSDDYRPALSRLGTGYRFLAPDSINWPLGDPKPNAQAFPMMVDQIREFQDVLGIKSSVVVGATMGGWIAGLLAYESPNRVDKVVITGNPGFHGAPNDRLGQGGIPEYDRTKESLGKQMVGASEAEIDALVKQKIARLSEPGYLDAYQSMMRTMADHQNRKEYNLMRRLPYFTMPTLCIIGRGDPSSEKVDEIKKALPSAKIHIIEDGAHQVHYDNADEFCKVLSEFLAS
jgi:pimeloyl-ACP methyl ester carboxylesterase